MSATTRQQDKTLQITQLQVTRQNLDLFTRLATALNIPMEEDLGALADSLSKREERLNKK